MESQYNKKKVSRIAFLCQVFHPDYSSTSQLYTDLLSELSKHNKKITVVCGYPALLANSASTPAKEEFQGITILRVGVRLNYRKNYFYRAIHYLAYLIGVFRVLFKLRQFDYIIAVTNPPILPAFLGLMRRFITFRYVLLLLDIFPEGLVALGKWKENSSFVKLYKALNKQAYNKAEKVFTVGRDMRDLIINGYNISSDKVAHFPEWSSFKFSESSSLRPELTNLYARLDLRGKFIVQYSGNMALWHDINTLVRSAKILNNRSDIIFVIIGGGVRLKEAKELAENLKVKNIHWLPFQPKEDLGDTLACCHMALISQRKELSGIAVPCKIYGILASGRGVLAMAPKNSEAALIVSKAQCGLIMESDDSKALAEAIILLANNSSQVVEFGRNAYAEYKRNYTLESAVQKALKLWE